MKLPHCSYLLLIALLACGRQNTVGSLFSSATPYERYEKSLKDADLIRTALGQAWLAAGQSSLYDSLNITLPFREVGHFAAERPEAVAFRYPVRTGQIIDVSLQPSSEASVFLDVFVVENDTTFQRIISADSTYRLSHEVEHDEIHALRLQPELLQSLTYELVIEARPSLSFPVAGKNSKAIGSFFGAPRDGGARRHKGVDIFAPKGTPVLAASDGVVGARTSSRLGGKVVWLSAEGMNQYYAHLDSQVVRPLARVNVGDTLGFVGNTGNARYTPPHLHFGIYRLGRGALDPYPFLYDLAPEAPLAQADTGLLASPARISAIAANVRAAPTTESAIVNQYDQHTLVHLHGTSGQWFRAELPDGERGYLHQSLIGPAEEPIRQIVVTDDDQLYLSAEEPAFLPDALAGQSVPVLASFDSLLWVETPAGVRTWLYQAEQI